MTGVFTALVDAVTAAQDDDANALRAAVHSAPAEALFNKAVAHRCAGLLFAAMVRHRIRDERTTLLWRMMQGYAGNCVLDSERSRAQIDAVVRALADGGVPHALLKGAARLRSGDGAARWSHMDDIDVLIPPERSDQAMRALQSRGYRFDCDDRARTKYRTRHHHLAPLVPEGGGKPVELHVNLEYRPWFSSRSDWATLAEHLRPDAAVPGAFLLDPFGRALHALIHGVALYRLGDAAVLARELRAMPMLLQPLSAWVNAEAKQRVALRAVLALASQIARVPIEADLLARRYLEWVAWREQAPRLFHGRMQLLDAYFSHALSLGIPGDEVRGLDRPRMMSVRIGAALAASAYRALLAR